MNEDEHGITPAGVTAITVEPREPGWLVTIEQGNGDVVKQVQLTDMERMQLGMMLDCEPGTPLRHVSFADFSRQPRST